MAGEWIAGLTPDLQHIDEPFTPQKFAIVVSYTPRRFIPLIIVKISTLQCKGILPSNNRVHSNTVFLVMSILLNSR